MFYSRPSSPKSDSELCKPQESLGPQMQWNWGAFPKVQCCIELFCHYVSNVCLPRFEKNICGGRICNVTKDFFVYVGVSGRAG